MNGLMTDYRVLASAVAGRTVAIGADPASTYTDGATIYVAEHATPDEARRSVVVQAALLAAGSLDRTLLPGLIRARRPVLRRYLTLEVVRACDRLRAVLPRPVTAAVDAVYPGAVPGSAQDSLRRARRAARIPDPPPWFGSIRPVKALLTGPDPGASPLTEDDLDGRTHEVTLPELDEQDEETAERSKIMELLSGGVGNPLGAALQRMLGMGRTPSGAGGGGGQLPVGGQRTGPVGPNARRVRGGVRLSVAAVPVAGARYPEWNWARRAYRDAWCAVGEFDPPPDESPPAATLRVDRELRAALSRLGLSWERHRRRPDGDLLDLSALVDHRIAVAAGFADEPYVYESSRRTGRDLGVLVLLDATGSAAEEIEGRAVFEDQRRLAWQLTAVLDELGVRVAAYAFSSRGRENVRFLRVKGFDDRFDRAARTRLLALQPGGFTRLGAVFRHGTHLLTTRAGTPSMLMVVVGDGLPYDDGYEDRYAREDSRRALAEATARGVACAGIGVGASVDDDALRWIWAHAPHRVVRDARELACEVRPLFGTALRQASATPRRSSRTTAHAGRQGDRVMGEARVTGRQG